MAEDGRSPDDHDHGAQEEKVAVTVATKIRMGRVFEHGLRNIASLQAGEKQVKAGIKAQPQADTCNHVKKWSCP